jgi:hypothetical protein
MPLPAEHNQVKNRMLLCAAGMHHGVQILQHHTHGGAPSMQLHDAAFDGFLRSMVQRPTPTRC